MIVRKHLRMRGPGSWLSIVAVLFAAYTCSAQDLSPERFAEGSAERLVCTILDSAHKAEASGQTLNMLRYCQQALEIDPLIDSMHVRKGMYWTIGNMYNNMGGQHLALPYIRKAVSISNQLRLPSNSHEPGNIGTIFLRLGQADSAFHYFRLELAYVASKGKKLNIASAHNNLGMAFARFGEADSARQRYNTAMELLLSSPDRNNGLQGSIRDNLAELALSEGQLEDALAMFGKNMAFFSNPDFPLNKKTRHVKGMQAAIGYTRAAAATGQHELAVHLADSLMQVLKQYDFSRSLEYHLTCSRILAGCYNFVGQTDSVVKYQGVANTFGDSMLKLAQATQGELQKTLVFSQLNEVNKELTVNQLELQNAEAEANYQRTLIWIMIMATSLILVLAVVLVRRRLMQQRSKMELAEVRNQLTAERLKNEQLAKEQIAKSLQHKKQDLSEFALAITQRQQWSEEVLERLKAVRKLKGEARDEALRDLSLDLQQQVATTERKQVLQQNVEQVNAEFYDKIKTDYPKLTRSELELCALIRLNLSSKDIAAIRSVEPKSIEMARYRLRKKFAMEGSEDLAAFLGQY